MLFTSVMLPIERNGTEERRLSSRISVARSPRSSRVLLQASGSRRVLEKTTLGRAFIRVLISSVADAEMFAIASYVVRPMIVRCGRVSTLRTQPSSSGPG